MTDKLNVIKGTDMDMKCYGGFQYEQGKEYREERADLCHAGFHGVENALDVMRYFSPGQSRYFEAELGDVSDQTDGDTKRVGKSIRLGAEIGIKGVIEAGIRFVFRKCETSTEQIASGVRGNAAASGWRGNAAASGERGNAAASGWRGNAAASGESGNAAASGERGNAAASGWRGNAAASGESGNAAASGVRGNAAASGESGNAAASGESGNAAASGESGNAAASGWSGNAAASGVRGTAVSTGRHGTASALGSDCIAVAWGEMNRARGIKGCYLVLSEHFSSKPGIKAAKMVKVDGKKIKENTWYALKGGKVVEVEDD